MKTTIVLGAGTGCIKAKHDPPSSFPKMGDENIFNFVLPYVLHRASLTVCVRLYEWHFLLNYLYGQFKGLNDWGGRNKQNAMSMSLVTGMRFEAPWKWICMQHETESVERTKFVDTISTRHSVLRPFLRFRCGGRRGGNCVIQ